MLGLIDLKQEEFGFILVILWEAESTVDKPWVSEDVNAAEAAGLKMEKRLPLEGGYGLLSNGVRWDFGQQSWSKSQRSWSSGYPGQDGRWIDALCGGGSS